MVSEEVITLNIVIDKIAEVNVAEVNMNVVLTSSLGGAFRVDGKRVQGTSAYEHTDFRNKKMQ